MPRPRARSSTPRRPRDVEPEHSQAPWRARYGPWALITGGSRGIGYAFGSRVAAQGVHVALVARRDDTLAPVAEELRGRYGVEVLTIPADLAESDACVRVAARTQDLDVGFVVLAAGSGCQGELTSHPLADERRITQLNVVSTLELTHTFSQRLRARGSGGLVIVSSLLAYQGAPHAANYAATKAYGLVLAESLHFELRPHGIDVLGLAPGPTSDASHRVENRRFPARQWCSAAQVVDVAMGALGRRASVVPGALNNLFLSAGGHAGREARSHLIGRVAEELTDEAGA